jgi:16S rRNA (guanine(966)-N(2))-methyltransferase RsmD
MRIITGKARGVRLDTLDGLDTRPTSERTKEAVFSMLQFQIVDSIVLDLFSGSGQMGLEALSRGAKRAYLVDKSKNAMQIIKKNVEKCRLVEGACVICEESLSFLKKHIPNEKFDIVFLDPPYATSLIDESIKILRERELIGKDSVIVCESDRFEILGIENSEKYDIIKSMKHGIAHISVLKLKGGC